MYDQLTVRMLAAAEATDGHAYAIGFTIIGLFGLGWLIHSLIYKRIGMAVGVALALAAHSLFLFGSSLFNFSWGAKKHAEEDLLLLSPIEMPDVVQPVEEPVVVESDTVEDVPVQIAPPSLADVPSAVSTSDFVQKPAPPPPPDAVVDKSAMTIPVNRGPTNVHMKDLFDIRDLDQIPVPIQQVEPTYPYELKRQGIEGSVLVEFIVDKSGKVVNAFIVKSTNPEFEQPTLTAVQKWRFRPGKKGGRVVNTRVRQPIPFHLN